MKRFRTKYIKLPNGCWEWQAFKNKGYGMFQYKGRPWLAHRVAYLLEHRLSPEDMEGAPLGSPVARVVSCVSAPGEEHEQRAREPLVSHHLPPGPHGPALLGRLSPLGSWRCCRHPCWVRCRGRDREGAKKLEE